MVPVPVLLYHDVTTGTPADRWTVRQDALAAHLDAVLDSGRTVLTASRLAARLFDVDADGAAAGVCAVTFDDGFASFTDLAMPLLGERGLDSTVYLTTGLLDRPGMLSRSAVADLYRSGGAEVGAHAVRHRHLDLLAPADLRAEVEGCRSELGELTGRLAASFAYPHGSFTRAVRDAVREAGYGSGYAVRDAFTHVRDDRFAIARLTVHADTPPERVRQWLSGRGAPLSWRRERLRTKVFRQVRRLRASA